MRAHRNVRGACAGCGARVQPDPHSSAGGTSATCPACGRRYAALAPPRPRVELWPFVLVIAGGLLAGGAGMAFAVRGQDAPTPTVPTRAPLAPADDDPADSTVGEATGEAVRLLRAGELAAARQVAADAVAREEGPEALKVQARVLRRLRRFDEAARIARRYRDARLGAPP